MVYRVFLKKMSTGFILGGARVKEIYYYLYRLYIYIYIYKTFVSICFVFDGPVNRRRLWTTPLVMTRSIRCVCVCVYGRARTRGMPSHIHVMYSLLYITRLHDDENSAPITPKTKINTTEYIIYLGELWGILILYYHNSQ